MSRPIARAAAFDQLVAVRERERPQADRVSRVVPAGHQLYVRGWVVPLENETISVRIDGSEQRTPVLLGLARPDVAQSIGDDRAGLSGFEVFVDTASLNPGEHAVHLLSSSANGTDRAVLSTTFEVGKPWPHTTLQWRRVGGNVSFDRIKLGDRHVEPYVRAAVIESDELIQISGWAFNGIEKKAGIAVYAIVDDADAIRLRYGLDRSDVADVHGEPNLRYCGFIGFIHLGAFGSGTHLLRIVILMEDGSAVAAEDSLAFRVR